MRVQEMIMYVDNYLDSQGLAQPSRRKNAIRKVAEFIKSTDIYLKNGHLNLPVDKDSFKDAYCRYKHALNGAENSAINHMYDIINGKISNNTANNAIQSSNIDSPRYDFNTKSKANKQKILKDICAKHFSTHTHERLSLDELKASVYYDEIVNVYHRLGGILTTIPARVGEYDIDTPNFIIELDEENHFNRYRLSTLQSDVYNDNYNLDVELYKGYCKSYENKCCTYGQYASSDSTNKQFGKSVVDGDLKDVNRTRWKQRAFYDYIKDITSLVIGVPIIRISIYEVYKGKTIETLIKNHCEDLLIEYINMRLEKCK